MGRRGLTTFLGTTAAVMVLGAAAFAPAPAGPEPEPTPGGVIGGPLEHVGPLPVDAGNGFGSSVHENLLIVTGPTRLTIYDTTQFLPGGELPTPIGIEPLGGIAWNEEPRTDGTRLLLQDDRERVLHLYDISDPTDPRFVTSLDTPGEDHLWACVFDDCSIVYGSHGMILDITDMNDPVVLGDWTQASGVEGEVGRFHAIDEVAPGIVMTGSEPMYLLDARQDAANPTVIASGRMDENGMLQARLDTSSVPGVPEHQPVYAAARVEWPARTTPGGDLGQDALLPQHERWGIVSVETPLATDCSEDSGGLLTYDMSRVADGTFTVADDFRITHSGSYLDGYAPVHGTGCFAYGFSQHPDYSETRLVAVAWTEHGMRLFTVGEDDGHIDEVGYFVGYGGDAADAEWIAEDLIAITDMTRGVDVVRVDLTDL